MKTCDSPSSIEVLETRIAPAKLLTLVDVDGDLITITTTKGTDADLLAAVTTSTPAGAVPGGVFINVINLGANAAAFDGTSITITAKRGPLGGDGLVNVGTIVATGLDLGTVTVKGDLFDIDAGKNTPGSKVAAINVDSTTGDGTWSLACSVGSLTVKTDVTGTEIAVIGASLGKLSIGGSLLGKDVFAGGYIHVDNGTLGKVTIGGSIVGGSQTDSGKLEAKSITSVTIGGSLIGGSGLGSGQIRSTDTAGSIGSITITGDVRGGANTESGRIYSQGSLGATTVGGSVIGGGNSFSGVISAEKGIGQVKVGYDIVGGTVGLSGIISSAAGIAGVTIGGSLLGGTGTGSGSILAVGGNIGPINIRGDLQGGPANAAGVFPSNSGRIFAQVGTFGDADFASIASITIGGSVVGGGFTDQGQIFADGNIGQVKISGDLRGGTGLQSGFLKSGKNLGLVSIGGSMVGGSGGLGGSIQSNGKLDGVKVGGSMVGGSGPGTATILSIDTLGTVAITGSVIGSSGSGSGYINGDNGIGKVTIGLDLVGGDGKAPGGSGIGGGGIRSLSGGIASITIGGDVLGSPGGEFNASIRASGNIGPIVIRGDLESGSANSSAVLPIDSGVIVARTTSDATFASIASLTIGGSVIGRGPNTYGQVFADGDVGPVKIGGDLRGAVSVLSGAVRTGRDLGFVSIGGSVLGGDNGGESGAILAVGKVAGVKIGGSLVGGSGGASGRISSQVAIGPVTIGGDFIGRGNAGGFIGTNGTIGAIFIGGSVLSFGGPAQIASSNEAGLGNDTRLSLKSLTIGGSASGLEVIANGADDIIGPIKIGGDWREGSIRAAVNFGGDIFFGTNDDVAAGIGDPDLFSKITSITIGGAVFGTAGPGDHFGFVAQEIGALSIAGTKIPLERGPGNDTDATLGRYIISSARDFTVHEVA